MPQLKLIEITENSLRSSANDLQANNNFTSKGNFPSALGLILFRHAYGHYLTVKDDIKTNLSKHRGKTRPLTKEDFSRKSMIFLPPDVQFDSLVSPPDNADRAKAVIDAAEAIQTDDEAQQSILPKDKYQEVDHAILGQLLRSFNDPALIITISGIYRRISEHVLSQFASAEGKT